VAGLLLADTFDCGQKSRRRRFNVEGFIVGGTGMLSGSGYRRVRGFDFVKERRIKRGIGIGAMVKLRAEHARVPMVQQAFAIALGLKFDTSCQRYRRGLHSFVFGYIDNRREVREEAVLA